MIRTQQPPSLTPLDARALDARCGVHEGAKHVRDRVAPGRMQKPALACAPVPECAPQADSAAFAEGLGACPCACEG